MNKDIDSHKYNKLFTAVSELYHLPENKAKLLFHGWHHIKFVHDKAIEFAKELQADLEIAAAAALLHDLNYVFTDKLEPEAARLETAEYLKRAGYTQAELERIEQTIEDAHTDYRGGRELSEEAKALADADTLFKALPTTPILFASRFIEQNKYDVEKLAHKVIDEQEPLLVSDQYFYTQLAKANYSDWAEVNLQMWKNVLAALGDASVREMLQTAKELGVLT